MKPWRCVICCGSGKGAAPVTGTNAASPDCHACHGSGVLWGPDDYQAQPAPIYPTPWPPYGPWWGLRPYSVYGTGTLSATSIGTAYTLSGAAQD